MSNIDEAWLRYAELQQRSSNTPYLNDFTWGIECALDYLLHAIQTDTVPLDLDEAIKRTIASGSRRQRSRSLTLKTWMAPPESNSTSALAEARLGLERIRTTVKDADRRVLFDAGFGYTDREIADRHGSTPGAIRVRLSRLRLKLAA
jgi:hypothetical protein